MRGTVRNIFPKSITSSCALPACIVLGKPTHLCFDTCDQFQRIKWLCHVVICPEHQTVDLVHIFCFCRQHNNRKIIFFTVFREPQIHQYPEASHPEVPYPVLLLNRYKCIFSCIKLFDLKAFVFQIQFITSAISFSSSTTKIRFPFCTFLLIQLAPTFQVEHRQNLYAVLRSLNRARV